MTNSIALVEPTAKVIVGVDTHKLVHVAVAINLLGARLATISIPADRAGYAELVAWARALGIVEAFGIEGTGSYGVGLASFVRRQAHQSRRGQSLRPSQASQQRQERHHRRRDRSPVRAVGDRDGCPEDR